MVTAASVLIADDEGVFRETTADLLRLRGYRCECVAEAQAALAALADQSFDLLIADIRMPGNSDLQLVRDARRCRPDLAVILVTGAPSLDSAIHSVQLPVSAYLTKPLDLDSFYRHVDQCVARSSIRRVLQNARQVFITNAETLDQLEANLSADTRNATTHQIAETASSAVRIMLDSLQALEPFWQRYTCKQEAAAIQTLLTSPRETALQEALEYAVLVLERTRNTFKSKELGELRRRLTRLLKTAPA